MNPSDFEYGPIARGSYIAMISVVPVVSLYFPPLFLPYVGLVLLIGLFLKSIIRRSGIDSLLWRIFVSLDDKIHAKLMRKKIQDVEMNRRNEKYRRRHRKDSSLPKNW